MDLLEAAEGVHDEEDARREIGDEAVWSLSSAKPGNGVRQLRDSTWRTGP
jgi:hypothetical protein